MKKIPALLIFILGIEVYSQDLSTPKPGLRFNFQWILFKDQGREKDPKADLADRFSGTAQPLGFGFIYQKETNVYRVHLDWVAIKGTNENLFLLPGENSYLGLLGKGFLWAIGRRSDPTPFPAWSSWKDGVEGAFVENLDPDLKIRFDLLDLYRGFPLWENSWLRLQGREQFLPKEASDTLVGKNSTPDPSYQSRYRAGFLIQGNREDRFVYLFQVRYLSLGDLGRFGEDKKESRSGKEDGDKDYLVEWKVGLGFLWKYVYLSADLFLSRGIDKTAWDPARPQRSLPISGEAVRFDLGVYLQNARVSFFGFLPNQEKRKANGQILELGFVGMGASPISNPILQQIWGFYPSSWVTSFGLEREETKYPGKRPASLLGIRSEWKEHGLLLGIHFSYISFLKEEGSSSGAWIFSRKGIGPSFVREGGVSLGWIPEGESVPVAQIEVGGFETDESIGIKNWYLLLQVRAIWE
ncbi:hypothetical protein EHQ53_02935 [Leptospira langatensis]|uniref:Alginate export domain-containing protein n=1 Tax=Leptospira langatensis TaxID=2484983 RepID=A0A5F2A041_9LEPT|nr:hypothetical protein [Leptospira langatensis]TGK04119.1 hypothetical protein EHO57_03165 [Leptospira langatensis]TGL43599.1 hypothetical protein EHQ53_02935 [Leptospira langatensis]